jgi:4-aminobutyrate aminotransferase-like enzyme
MADEAQQGAPRTGAFFYANMTGDFIDIWCFSWLNQAFE